MFQYYYFYEIHWGGCSSPSSFEEPPLTQIPFVSISLILFIFAQVMQSLMSSTDNELYAHYIFLDESFSLPSASGLPLKFSLSGVFAPGAKGGLNFSPGMVSCLLFCFYSIKCICLMEHFECISTLFEQIIWFI